MRLLANSARDQYMLQEDPSETYLDGESVYCLAYADRHTLIACCYNEADFKVIDRRVKQVVRTIENPTDSFMFNSLQNMLPLNNCT